MMSPEGFVLGEDGKFLFQLESGEFKCCVACGRPLEYKLVDGSHYQHHRCSEKYERRRRAAEEREHYDRQPAYGERLALGFAMLRGDSSYERYF